jgi:hypothetical protein
MNGYSIALFLHVAGVLGMFAVLGLEWTGLRQLRSAQSPEPVRAWMQLLRNAQKAGFASMLAILLSGFYMMATVWGSTAWIAVSMVALALAVLLGLALTGPRMKTLGQALAAGKGQMTQAFSNAAQHPLLLISVQTRMAIALGVVFLKTTKPDLGGSLLIIGIATVLGIASALPLRRHAQVPQASAQ